MRGEISFETFLDDLETVVDSLRLERFVLLGMHSGAAVSIAYAVRYPKRVWKLVLLGGYAQGHQHTTGPIAPKSLERFKQRIRDITRRAKGISMTTTMEELAPYMRGWRGYFGFCETPEVLIALTRWVRLRLRAALWRQWKTPRRRRAALIALRVSGELRNTAGSGRGPWYIARSKALSVGLSNVHFKSLGLPSLIEAR